MALAPFFKLIVQNVLRSAQGRDGVGLVEFGLRVRVKVRVYLLALTLTLTLNPEPE